MSPKGVSAGFWLLLTLLVLLVGILLTTGTNELPLDPRSVADDGAKGLVDLIDSFGGDVELGVSVPAERHDVAILLRDDQGTEQRDAVESWVRSGGRLVVADPASPLTPRAVAAAPTNESCTTVALGEVEELAGTSARYQQPADGTSCLNGTVTVDPVGDGFVVSLGGPEPLLNEYLDQADNSVLAVNLIAPRAGTRVAFLETTPVTGTETEELTDLVPRWVWVLLIQLGVAFILFAWWKARRLGAPVAEPVPVAIEGSELAIARGRLLQGIHRPEDAAVELRAATLHEIRQRLGLPPDAGSAVVASSLCRVDATRTRGGFTHEEMLSILEGRRVTSDPDLHHLAVDLAALRASAWESPRERGDAAAPVPASEGALP